MNNVECNSYRNIPLCDSHMHFSVAVPIASTVTTFRERTEYFSLDRISLMATAVCSNRVDPCTNIKALYVKDILNRELIAQQAEILLCDLKSGKETLWTEEEQKLETENAAVVLNHFKG